MNFKKGISTFERYFGSRVFIFFSLSAREVGHNFSLSASLKRRRRRYHGVVVGIPLALVVAITISITTLLNCSSFLHRVIQSPVS